MLLLAFDEVGMGDIQKVSVALTSGQLAALKAVVNAGEYATTSEIVREALRDWQHKRDLRQEEIKPVQEIVDQLQSALHRWTLARTTIPRARLLTP